MLHTKKNEMVHFLIIAATLVLAIILTLLPMPHIVLFFRPEWLLLVLIYWALILPGRVSIAIAWVLGVVLDVLNGTLLGEHALALTLVIYLVARLTTQLRMFSLFQQGISVFFMVLLYQFVLFCVQGFIGDLPASWLYWVPALTSMLLWPWVCGVIRSWSR